MMSTHFQFLVKVVYLFLISGLQVSNVLQNTVFAFRDSARTIEGLQGLGAVPVFPCWSKPSSKQSMRAPVEFLYPPDADSRQWRIAATYTPFAYLATPRLCCARV